MHASSYENMQKCRDRYLRPLHRSGREEILVLDIGSGDVNGSYRGIFGEPGVRYLGVDLEPGPGVDLVAERPDRIPVPDASADVVISGQMLEHCERFWLLFEEMMRVLKPDGLLFLVAPSAGPMHRYPVDCYRFYPDAYGALARINQCHLVDCWLDERGPWKDLVGVFSKQPVPRWTGGIVGDEGGAEGSEAFDASSYLDRPGIDSVAGSLDYLELLARIHAGLAPRRYVEIGIGAGRSLALAKCPAIGVDPKPAVSLTPGAPSTICRRRSDDFFDLEAPRMLAEGVDLAFVDGLHRFENVLRDFMNLERYCGPGSLIVIDDIYPNHPVQASRVRQSRVWTGDVWKLHGYLKLHRPDLALFRVDTSPAGCLLVAGLDSANRRLTEIYNPAIREYLHRVPDEPPPEILSREGAIEPDDPQIGRLLRLLRGVRDGALDPAVARGRLKNIRAEMRAAKGEVKPRSLAERFFSWRGSDPGRG